MDTKLKPMWFVEYAIPRHGGKVIQWWPNVVAFESYDTADTYVQRYKADTNIRMFGVTGPHYLRTR